MNVYKLPALKPFFFFFGTIPYFIFTMSQIHSGYELPGDRFTEDQERESYALKGGEGDPRGYTVEGLRPILGQRKKIR